MPRKLQYFNLNGLAEPIRYILHYTKQDFEDVRHDIIAWPDLKIKASDLPFGQFPVYEEDGKVLTQTLAIAKYVARGTDLVPTDPWQQAVVEAAVLTLFDYWKNALAYLQEQDKEKKAQMKDKILNETIDYYFSRFNKQLEESGGYFIGKLSWGELILIGVIEASNLFLEIELEKKYPAVDAVVQKIRNLPGVKEYIAARGPYILKNYEKKFK